MKQMTTSMTIVIAAIFAFLYTVVAGLLVGQMDNQQFISSVALGSFLGGVVSPFVGSFLTRKKAETAQTTPVASPDSQNGDSIKTLYVGNLPFKTTEESVQEAFERYGSVQAVRLVKDKRSGRKKGYGFVEMDATGADLALAKLNDQDFEGRTMKVRPAHTDKSDQE